MKLENTFRKIKPPIAHMCCKAQEEEEEVIANGNHGFKMHAQFHCMFSVVEIMFWMLWL